MNLLTIQFMLISLTYKSPHYPVFFTFLVCSKFFSGPYFQIHCIRFLLLGSEVRFQKCRQNIVININIKIVVLFYALFVLCRSVYCLCVNVYCSLLLPPGGYLIAVKYIISYNINIPCLISLETLQPVANSKFPSFLLPVLSSSYYRMPVR